MNARREALAPYRDEPSRVRLHVAGRWATAPLARVVELAGAADRYLDVGCGHGLLSLYLARTVPGARVLGVDTDPSKIAVAERAARAAGLADRVAFGRVGPGWAPEPGSAGAVLVVDVLYLLPASEARALLSRVAAAVAPGGTVVVKEMAVEARRRLALLRIQEAVATGPLGMTDGRFAAFHPPELVEEELGGRGLVVTRVDLGRGRLHPHLAVVGRSPSAVGVDR